MMNVSLNRLIGQNIGQNGSRFFHSSCVKSAGHSKWANIKHKKAANDAMKATQSFRMSKQIQVFAKMGGSDLSQNIQLSNAIDKAKSMSIPKKVIENAIKRGTGELKSTEKTETVTYEGLAPGGVAVVIEAITDNKNRTIGFIRPCFSKFSLNMTPTLYMFERKGVMLLNIGELSVDEVFEELIEIGCEDINEVDSEDIGEKVNGTLVEIITDAKDFGKVAKDLKDIEKFEIKEMSLEYVPNEDTMVEISDEDTMTSYEKFMNLLDEVEDIQHVYSNLK